MNYKDLLNKILRFCNDNEDVRALILVGSQAREVRHADEYSDMDLIMAVKDIDSFVLSNDWISEIEDYHMAFITSTVDGNREKRVLFSGALEVDFVLMPNSETQQVLDIADAGGILSKGYKLLLNKDCYIIPERVNDPVKYQPPSEADFNNVVNDFWYQTIWTARKLLRGELWAAMLCVDRYMKDKLLWMIEHYEHAVHGDEYDTWYSGRFIDSWAEDEIKEGLSKAFARYNKADILAALFETMKIFRSLSVQVAEAHSYTYPLDADEFSTKWIQDNVSV